MPSILRGSVAPLYLLACLLLGGSAQGVWQNALLQLSGLLIILWAVAWPPADALPRSARPLLWIVLAGAVVVAIQSIPLPSSIWAHGARLRIADGYQVLSLPIPALPLSLTPYKSLNSLLGLIPPLAMFCAIVRLRAYRPSWLAAALLAGTVAGILLGVLQIASAQTNPRWYPYPETNIGAAVGFFANANHMAMLLLIAFPFAAAIGRDGSQRGLQRASALLAGLGGLALLLIVGIALNGALAAFALIAPVIMASALILLSASKALTKILGLLSVALLAGGLVLLSSTSIGATKIGSDAHEAVGTRAEILRTTAKATADYFPAGSGLGSFRQVYRTYESPDAVTTEYVIHAHNDYAELILELGAAGVVLIVIFLAWWGSAVWSVWRRGEGGPYVRAASIASAVLLAHSLVEFPLRTASLSVVFALSLAMLADRRRSQQSQPADLRPTRHIVIG